MEVIELLDSGLLEPVGDDEVEPPMTTPPAEVDEPVFEVLSEAVPTEESVSDGVDIEIAFVEDDEAVDEDERPAEEAGHSGSEDAAATASPAPPTAPPVPTDGAEPRESREALVALGEMLMDFFETSSPESGDSSLSSADHTLSAFGSPDEFVSIDTEQIPILPTSSEARGGGLLHRLNFIPIGLSTNETAPLQK